jgi:hypothetical protein
LIRWPFPSNTAAVGVVGEAHDARPVERDAEGVAGPVEVVPVAANAEGATTATARAARAAARRPLTA